MLFRDFRASPRFVAEAMLALATFFWGWTFPVVKDAVAVMPVFAFLALRFALATALMAPLAGAPTKQSLATGFLLGVLLFGAFAFQTAGLALTDASKSAFVTGLNVVWAALLTACDKRAWGGVGLAVAGLWLLTNPAADGFNLGDALTVVCSLFIAAHLLALSRLRADANSGELAIIQFAVVAVLSLCASLLFEENRLPAVWSGDLLFALALTAVGATVFSFWAQTHFQRRTTAVRAGLIFILEPVFAALFAVLFYGERLPPSAWLGAVFAFAAMFFAITPKRRGKAEK